MRTLLTLAITITITITVAASTARAEDGQTTAEARIDAGKRLLAAGKYAEARAEFEQARRALDAAAPLYFIAESYRREGDFEAARAAYARFVHDSPAGHPLSADARQYISMLDRALLQRKIAATPDSAPRVDGETKRLSRDATALVVSAGVAAVSVATLIYGSTRIGRAEMDVQLAMRNSSTPGLWSDSPTMPIDVCAVSESAFAREVDPVTAARVESACDRGARWETVNNYVAIPLTAVGLVATGVFAYRLHRRTRGTETRLRVAPILSPSATGARLQLDF